ncbi:hypothetical protein K2Z84_25465 [Candidatus Binatia bacterium]|nr:hypothetical protein [Candidatus Binatia bacterium]
MSGRKRYRRKASSFVTAVRIEFDTDGISYRKWGATQHAKQGDWLVDSKGDVYTVDADVFARTYRRLSPGVYIKTTPVWAEIADAPGAISTKEGRTHYEAGDYLVFNDESGGDGYAVQANEFEENYEPD